MPYADPERRRAQSKLWRDEKIKQGYGKALYRRRAARYQNEEILRTAVEHTLEILRDNRRHLEDKVIEAEFLLDQNLKFAPPVGPPSKYMP